MRPMSYYVEASKRSRKRREQQLFDLIKKNSDLALEIQALNSRSNRLREELDTLVRYKSEAISSRRRQEVLNESLKFQILEHRLLFSKLRQQFREIDDNLIGIAILNAMKQNIAFLFQEMEAAISQTRFISDSFPVPQNSSKFSRKRMLYQEMINVMHRYFSYSYEPVREEITADDVICWFPAFDFSLLDCRRLEFEITGEEKIIRIDFHDIPLAPKILQAVFKRIDFFTILMMSSEAMAKNVQENEGAVSGKLMFQDSWNLTLDLLPQHDDVVQNFSVALSRPASLMTQELSLLSACKMSDDPRNPSYIIQCPVRDPSFVVESDKDNGSFYFRGMTFRQGQNENSTKMSLIMKLRRPRNDHSHFSQTIDQSGGQDFMKKNLYDPVQVINLIEAILKCSVYIYFKLYHHLQH